mmetsp:Transcript_89229/g.268318  ORF Transcript_89229/g.268318 Transcript_89229/m.268318 type:complete len:313 (+) Transcript_89229:177-1115(+)
MIEDLFLFLEYYLLIVAAFSLTFVGLGCAGMHDYADDFWTFDGVSTAAMWSIFGFLQPDKYETPLAMSTMYVYVLFANVTLVNLLIAMFSDTVQRVNRNASQDYAFKRYFALHFYLHVIMEVPPPFNMPYLLWCGLSHLYRRATTSCGCDQTAEAIRRRSAKAAVSRQSHDFSPKLQEEVLARAALRRQTKGSRQGDARCSCRGSAQQHRCSRSPSPGEAEGVASPYRGARRRRSQGFSGRTYQGYFRRCRQQVGMARRSTPPQRTGVVQSSRTAEQQSPLQLCRVLRRRFRLAGGLTCAFQRVFRSIDIAG